MTDYIKREDVKHVINKSKYYGKKVWYDILDDVYDIPSADVAPVRHGRWKHERLPSTSGGSYAAVRCSVCEYQYPMTETNYCPNCGAHMMDEEENDGNQ